MSFSDCHRFIAVGVDLRNDESQTFFIKDVQTNVFLNDRLENVFNVKFSKCANYLYYVKQDDRLWSNAIYKYEYICNFITHNFDKHIEDIRSGRSVRKTS